MLVSTILVTFLLGLLYFSTAFKLEADNIKMMQSVDGFSSPNGFSPEVVRPDDRLHYFMLTKTNQGDLLVIDNTVHLTLKQHGKYALLCVDSPGDTIRSEDLENIFRRFYTVDKARTGGSYGLGLSIADAIIREHNGKIWAESANGHNKFYVRLPLLFPTICQTDRWFFIYQFAYLCISGFYVPYIHSDVKFV